MSVIGNSRDVGFTGWTVLLGLLPMFVGVACYLGALSHGFVLDDLIHITSNPLLRSSAAGVDLFSTPTYPGNLYRPLVTLSYLLTYRVWELNPLPYHASNIILHGMICSLLFGVLLKLVRQRAALWIAVLFAIHPLHVEAVAGVSGRAELLAHLFGLSAIFVALRSRSIQSDHRSIAALLRGCAIFSGLLGALLAKESGVTYLLLLPLCIWFQERSSTAGNFRAIHKYRVELVSALLASGCYLALRWSALGALVVPISPSAFVDNPLLQAGTVDRVLNSFVLLGKYLYLSMAASPLGVEYSYVSQALYTSLLDAEALSYMVLFLLLLLIAFKGLKRREAHGFFALWFFSGFIVTSNVFFPIGTIFAERLAYISLAGAMGTLVLYLNQLQSRSFRYSVYSLLVCIYGFQTFLYVSVWRDSETLFTWQVKYSPTSVKALVNYSVVLRNAGKNEKAFRYAHRARELYPKYAEAAFALATIEYAQGKSEKGREYLLETIALNPDHTPALNMLGRALFNARDYEGAGSYFRQAMSSSPGNVDSQLGLLAIAISSGDVQTAVKIHRSVAPLAGDRVEFRQLDAAFKQLLKFKRPYHKNVV